MGHSILSFFTLLTSNSVSSSSASSPGMASSSSNAMLDKILDTDGANKLMQGHWLVRIMANTYQYAVWVCLFFLAVSVLLYSSGSSKNSDKLRNGSSIAAWVFYNIILFMYLIVIKFASGGQITGSKLIAVTVILLSEYGLFWIMPKQYNSAMHVYALHEMSDRADLKQTADKKINLATGAVVFAAILIIVALVLRNAFR